MTLQNRQHTNLEDRHQHNHPCQPLTERMSYSRTVNPRASRTQRGGGGNRAAANSYQPRPINSGHGGPGAPQDRPSERRRPPPQFSDSDGEEQPTTHLDYTAANSTTALASGQSRSLQSHGQFYVLPPNPQKNAKLKITAEQEASQFERHKAVKKQQTAEQLAYQPPAAVGGCSYSKHELDQRRLEQEQRQQIEAKFAKVRQRAKREEYHRQQREKEEEEIQQKKQVQREKAIRLQAKQKQEQQVQLEEMRRKRLERFDKK